MRGVALLPDRRRNAHGIAALSLAAALLGGATAADARVGVFIGLGVPGPYPYYPYSYYPYPYYYPPAYPYYYPYYTYSAPPAGWEQGHWEWRKNRWGRWVEVWVPTHLK